MNFDITEEQELMIETARRVGEKFDLPYWREKDEKKEFPLEMWKAICDAGLCGITIPTKYGGV